MERNIMGRTGWLIALALFISPALAGQVPKPINAPPSMAAGDIFYAPTTNEQQAGDSGFSFGTSGAVVCVANANCVWAGNDQFTGGVEIGSPTGGMPGAGILNSAAIKVNNVSVSVGAVTCAANAFANVISISVAPTCAVPTLSGLAGTITSSQLPALASANFWLGNGSSLATAVSLSGDATMANTGALTIANNAVTNAKLDQAATNTVKGNATSGTANETDLPVTSCSTSSSAIKWTTNTGFGCNTAINAATLGGVAIGTSGATIPTNNGANTYSGNTTFTGTRPIIIANSGPGLIWSETDQVLPAGVWDILANSGNFNVLRNTDATGNFGTFTIPIVISNADIITMLNPPVFTNAPLALAQGGTAATSASTARTSLGLGTSATVNTGTSGATIPLLNGANTFSGATETFSGLIISTLGTPASSSATCTTGTIEADTGFIYVCTATNTWKRTALSTF